MTPRLERQFLRYRLPFVLVFVVLSFVFIFHPFFSKSDIVVSPAAKPIDYEPPESLEWLYVQKNGVRLRAVLGERCHTDAITMALYQRGDKVLVIQRFGNGMVEVEADDQTKMHTRGCISETLLRQDK